MKLFLLSTCLGLALASSAWAESQATDRAALENRLQRLESVLATDICANPEPARAILAEPSSAKNGTTTPRPTNKTPPAASATDPAPTGAADTALSRADLVSKLKQSVALVITDQASGSGFFITPRLLLTNAHVVKGAAADKIFLIGESVGGGTQARLIARESGTGIQARDYAILQIDSPAAATLPLTAEITELEDVVAAGYPALLISNDINFQQLMRGKGTGLPDMILSQGSVMAVQNRNSRVPNIAHSAAISAGNSGGPLVDGCGRVVGINSFIRVSVDQASNAGYAIASDDMIRFLKEHGITPQIRQTPCR